MGKFNCFADQINVASLDRTPFKFRHSLADHPALNLENLAKTIPELASEKVMFSPGLSDLGVNFDDALNEGRAPMKMAELIESIRTSNSYLAIRNPESHPSFRDLYQSLKNEVGELLKENHTGTQPLEPMLWMFIASPNAVTPFHFDRFSNFLMQIRGSKEVAVFPPRVEKIISARDTEAYIDWSDKLPPWREEIDQYAHKFSFSKGEAIHIPYVSGHYVKNGAEDVSISLSFFFHSDETAKWTKAMQLNNRLRRAGLNPDSVGISPRLDALKAGILPVADGVSKILGKLYTR